MIGMTEEQLRTALGWLKAIAIGDEEAIQVLSKHTNLERLATDVAEICLLFVAEYGDPAHHVDLMFKAVDVTYSNRDEA